MGTLATPTITGISPTTLPSGTDAVLTITGSNFGSLKGTGFVEFRNANSSNPANLVQPLLSDYVSWTDTEIKVKVPSTTITGPGAGTGTVRVTNSDPATAISVDVLTIPYAYSNVPDVIGPDPTSEIPTHMNLNGAGGIPFKWKPASTLIQQLKMHLSAQCIPGPAIPA
ncbi:IPT/TIG domain-containing protein [Paraflavitalea speifideaquila]|uniref:IPT/TIG domain-containing protein n=1 Tax=Paraflavitalea speifideaquila TaxID=3076558 RepID=UPI0028EE0608|nr:IPT/TIG domain-containing protein [Paraflavitalea speifideiaquila]